MDLEVFFVKNPGIYSGGYPASQELPTSTCIEHKDPSCVEMINCKQKNSNTSITYAAY